MAGLLEQIIGAPGKAAAMIQAPILKARQGMLDEVEERRAGREQNRAQQVYGEAAAALNLNAPDIGFLAKLARADPAAASQLLGQAAQSRTPLGQQNLQNAQLTGQATRQGMQTQGYNNTLNALEEKRRQQAFPLEQQGRQLGIQGQQQQQQLAGLQIQELERKRDLGPTDAEIFEQEAGYPLPKDYIPGWNPNKKQYEPVPAPNTPPALKAQDEVAAKEELARKVTRFLALAQDVGPTGTEFIGPKASQLRAAREDVITAYRKAAELGTPTGGEIGRIDSILPDPTNFWTNWKAMRWSAETGGAGMKMFRESMLAPYMEMANTLQTDLATTYEKNWWVAPTPGILRPK